MESRANADTRASTAFEPGQMWKTEDGYILITDHADRIVGYRKLRNPEQRTALTHLIRSEALACYLQKTEAVLQK